MRISVYAFQAIFFISLILPFSCSNHGDNGFKDAFIEHELETAEKEIASAKKIVDNSKMNAKTPFDKKTGELLADKHTIVLYDFNDILDNIANDSSANMINGKLFDVIPIASPFGNAAYFDGKYAYMQADYNPKLDLDESVTVEVWAYIEKKQIQHWPVFLDRDTKSYSHGYPTYEMYIGNYKDEEITEYNNFFCWRVTIDDERRTLHSPMPWYEYAEKWHYYAGTYDGKITKFYIDGELIASKQLFGKLVNSKNPLYLSSKHNRKKRESENAFFGALDEVRLSNIARSEEEIKEYYNTVVSLGLLEKYKTE